MMMQFKNGTIHLKKLSDLGYMITKLEGIVVVSTTGREFTCGNFVTTTQAENLAKSHNVIVTLE